MTKDELKQNYNKTLDVIDRGGEYLDNPNISAVDKDKVVPKFRNLIDRANSILYELKQQGESYTDKQILEGFEIGGNMNG